MRHAFDTAREALSALDCGSQLPLSSVRQPPAGHAPSLHSITIILLLVCASSFTGCRQSHETTLQGQTMATTWKAIVVTNDSRSITSTLAPLLQSRLDELESLFSNWRPDSAVSRFNASTSTEWQPVPKELAEVVAFCQEISRETQGAFDVTAAPLIDLWGFGPRGPITSLPTDSAIAESKARCGWQKLEVKLDPPLLRKSQPDLCLNLSSLVEGYAVDELAKLLRARGIEHFLLEVGGELYASGAKSDGSPWQVGVQQPDANSEKGAVVGALPLRDKALSTSGTYRQFFEFEGKRYPHVLDARTRRPVEHGAPSVSVIADTCMAADGWSTALLILGPREGAALSEKHGLSAMFLTELSAPR